MQQVRLPRPGFRRCGPRIGFLCPDAAVQGLQGPVRCCHSSPVPHCAEDRFETEDRGKSGTDAADPIAASSVPASFPRSLESLADDRSAAVSVGSLPASLPCFQAAQSQELEFPRSVSPMRHTARKECAPVPDLGIGRGAKTGKSPTTDPAERDGQETSNSKLQTSKKLQASKAKETSRRGGLRFDV